MLLFSGAQRQKVKYATKLFSHTISKAISRMGMLGLYTTENNWSECSDFFKIVNDWFDVFNCQIPHPDSRTRVKGLKMFILFCLALVIKVFYLSLWFGLNRAN